MNSRREQFFALGVALGTGLGFVLGSMLALRMREDVLELVRHAIGRLLSRDDEPNFEYLLQ